MKELLSGESVDPLISVIIPVYNVAPYIREALDSVINQTYKKLEIIVVDDGSTDGSSSICEEYASRDSRFIVIHQPHQNVSVARNTALDVATGEYLAFIDPDDAYDQSFIRIMLDTIRREQTDVVICKYRIYSTKTKMNQREEGNTYPSIGPGLYNRIQALNSLLSGRIHAAIWNKLYKREVWNGVRFPTDLYAASDQVVSVEIFFNCSSVYVIDRPLYMYRKHPGSLTALCSNRIISSRILAFSYVSDFLRAHAPKDISEEQIRRYGGYGGYGIIIFNTAIIHYANCYKKDGSEYLKKQIIAMGDKIEIENCGLKTRTAYYMMQRCPWLLKYACTVYLQTSLFIRKITGNDEQKKL